MRQFLGKLNAENESDMLNMSILPWLNMYIRGCQTNETNNNTRIRNNCNTICDNKKGRK